MSADGFRSVFMVASCAGAALGCYLVSLNVASERAALEQVETEIVLAQRDIRLLQTEIGTRGRLAQLERWNVKVLALSAPSADQFVEGGFELARLVAPERKPAIEAPVVLASAPADGPKPQVEGAVEREQRGVAPGEIMHVASLKTEVRSKPELSLAPKKAPAEAKAKAPAENKAQVKASTHKAAKSPVAEQKASAAKPQTKNAKAASPKDEKKVAAKAKDEKKVAARAKGADPLAPLPAAKPKKIASATSKGSTKTP